MFNHKPRPTLTCLSEPIVYRNLFSLTLAVGGAHSTQAADPPRIVRENIEWLDVWVPSNNVRDQPRVLLIGDSITRGYSKTVEDLLNGKAIVARLTTSKSLGDAGLLDEVRLVLGQAKFDVVHFNNGMHGWGYTEDEYAKALPDLVAVIRKGAHAATLACATTTPARVAGKVDQIDPTAERGKARNQAGTTGRKSDRVPIQ